MSLVIRSCGPDDARALALVSQASFLETYAEVIPAADLIGFCERDHSVAHYAGWLTRPDHRLWLAQVASTGAPAGYCVLCPADLPIPLGPGDIELRRIYLLRRFQGGGMGAALLATAVAAATQAGFTRLLLSVFSENATARAFYARQGFGPAGAHKFRVGAIDYDDLVLARELGPAA